jgi:hypothetical protein
MNENKSKFKFYVIFSVKNRIYLNTSRFFDLQIGGNLISKKKYQIQKEKLQC